MRSLFGRRKQFELREGGAVVQSLPPLSGEPAEHEFVAIPKSDIPTLAEKYFAAMETEESAAWCKCLWRIHPDDQGIKPGHCRECNQPQKHEKHRGLPEDFECGVAHKFRGIRKTMVDQHSLCPVHTREGMLTYFFEWIFNGE